MSTEGIFFMSYVAAKADSFVFIFVLKECTLHVMRISSLNNKEEKTLRQTSKVLAFPTANGLVVSDTQANVFPQEFPPWSKMTHSSRMSSVTPCTSVRHRIHSLSS